MINDAMGPLGGIVNADLISCNRIAITGGTGFVGANLVARLQSLNIKIRLLTRSNLPNSNGVEYFQADLRSLTISSAKEFLKDVDVIIHCAGSLTDRDSMQAVHLNSTIILSEAAAQLKIRRFVLLSSVGVYGPRYDGLITEDEDISPVGLYETTKAKADQLLQNLDYLPELDRVILRPTAIFGQDMKNSSLKNLVVAINRKFFFYIGKPGASANYIHVSNVIDALVTLALCAQHRATVYNISDCDTLENFVGIIKNKINCVGPVRRIPKFLAIILGGTFQLVGSNILTKSRINNLTSRAFYSSERFQREFGYVVQYPLREALGDYSQKAAQNNKRLEITHEKK